MVDMEEFEYDGLLVFNRICRAEPIDNSIRKSDLEIHLPDYSRENQTVEEGFKIHPLSDYRSLDPTFAHDINKIKLDELIRLQYFYKVYEEIEAIVEGDLQEVIVPVEKSVDIYWAFPDWIFFKGSENDVERAKRNLTENLDGVFDIKPIHFDPDFLLWLFHKYYRRDSLSPRLQVMTLTDGKLQSEMDNFGTVSRVSDSTDTSRAIPILLGILRNKGFDTIGGDFEIDGDVISADISTSGRVHIKANSGAVRNATDLHRVLISTRFLWELSSLYTHWKSLPKNQKYPPKEFFEDLTREVERQGVELEFNPNNVVEKFEDKRGKK